MIVIIVNCIYMCLLLQVYMVLSELLSVIETEITCYQRLDYSFNSLV